ncbi:MAG: thioredoxin domain-containing protein [Candidatus Vogelbacteria bacterium]|nr:thioredoxin domain-containing protein [Candidatus Vogelbacteria bacterium]
MMENNIFRNIAIWLIIALTIVIVVLILVGLSSGHIQVSGDLVVPVNSSDHIVGTSTPKLTIVEYGDYQCPACAAFDPVVRKVMEEYSDKVQLVSRNFPLIQHRNATSSAKIVEAAGRQGKFFEMREKIYTGQLDWANSDKPVEIFTRYAVELGLNVDKLLTDKELPEITNKIETDLQGGKDSSVNSTPSFFLNGKKVAMPLNYEEFKKIVENNL